MHFVEEIENLGKGKWRLHFEQNFTCVLYLSEMRMLHIEQGQGVSDEKFRYLMDDILTKRAKKRAMHLLEQMDRTESQLREKLTASEYPKECIDTAIDYVKSFHYLDDLRYAQNYIRYKKTQLGRQQIKQKLLAKGVPADLIECALNTEYDSDESEHIRNLLDKKHYVSGNCEEKEFRRIYQYLLRRGFRSNDILKEMKKKELSD